MSLRELDFCLIRYYGGKIGFSSILVIMVIVVLSLNEGESKINKL